MKKILLTFMIFMTIGAMVFTPVFVKAESTDPIRIWFSQYAKENEALRSIASDYYDETGVEVEVVSRINVFNAPNDLVNNAQLDSRPDIVFMQATDIGGLVESGLLHPLNEMLDASLRSRYEDVAFDAFSLENEVYGVGYSIDTYGLVYNEDLVAEDELPETWDEFFQLAIELNEYDSSGDVEVHGTLLNAKDMWFNYPIIRNFGGYYYGKYPNGDHNPYDIGLNNQGMYRYVEHMKHMFDQDLILKNKVHGESEIVSRFAHDQVAMIIYGLWYASAFRDMGINYDIAPLPDTDHGKPSKALTTVQGFVVNRYTRDVEKTLSFLEFILEDDNQQSLIEAGNGHDDKLGTRNPANISVIQSDYIQSDKVLQSLSELNDNCEPFPNIPEGPIWYNYTPIVFQSIFFGDSSGNQVDYEERLDALVDKISDDVRLMNYQAEPWELPSHFWLYVSSAFLLVIVGFLFRRRYVKKKDYLTFKRRYSWKSTLVAWGLMMPLLTLLAVFYLFPILHNIYLSLTDYSGINLIDYGLVGFANYKDIFVSGLDGLISMTVWTLLFALSVVALSFLLGTFIATLLGKVGVRITKMYRIIFILPWVIPTVITLLMWNGLLETEGGLVNQVLSLVGMPAIPWLETAFWARVSTIGVMTWFSFPYFMIVATGLIKAIPRDLYEAAKMDGANPTYQFVYITLPLVIRAMIPTLIMSFIMQFNQFGVYILTGGGPASDKIGAPGSTDLLITYVFNTAFNTKRYAVAAAYSVLIFVFVGIFALLMMRINKKRMET